MRWMGLHPSLLHGNTNIEARHDDLNFKLYEKLIDVNSLIIP